MFFKSLFEYARSGLVRTMWKHKCWFFLLEQKASPFKTWSGFKGAIGTFPSILPFSGSPPPPPPLHLPFPPNYNPDPLIQRHTLRALATGMLPPTSL